MNKSISLAALAILILVAGCTNQKFKKSKSGKLEYKVLGGNSGESVKYGNAILFKAYSYYNDSLMSTPYDSVAQIIEIDSSKLPAEYVEIFTAAKKGDSIITRTSIDSIKKFNKMPSYAKQGFLGFHFKIVDIITDPAKVADLRTASMKTMRSIDSISIEKQKVIDDKTISDYLAKNNIKATKTTKGTYVEIQNPGVGDAIDSGKAITVDYKGMTLDGKEFDSSYDESGKSVKPFTFIVGQRGSIEGMSDGLTYFKKGGKGRLFIPSYLGYGERGAGADIKPNTPLIFEVSVLDVLTKEQYSAKMEEEQKKMQMMQQFQQHQNGGGQQQQQQPQEQAK
jgi:FKBP-type peptidyl-prolyl cis-trans isomerase FkpA